MTFLLQTLIAMAQMALAFFGFWLIWQVLLPVLPGPRDPVERIARFAGYFIDPLAQPLARALRVRPRIVSALLLLVVAAGQVALGRLSDSL